MATSSKVLMGILLFLGFPIWGSLALGAGCILLAFNILIVTPIIICGSMVLATLLTSIASIVTSFILMFDSFS
ncbi:MAG: hypothetical protein RSC29_05780, partial [Oscillospiraceae bacterium]